ncbi:MAG TPA: SRPBCC family protein [Actinomycetota bacterium]
MAAITESIDVAVPVGTAYNQWTQFEEFPRFMEGVQSVQQLDDTHLRWVAEIGGKREEWEAEITEQLPDERVAWAARGGKGNAGVVTFHRLNDRETRVTVQMDWQPEGVLENVGSALGLDDRQVSKDLDRFKELIESRGRETGAWRGEVR